jgi:hypothetical protein
MKWFYGVALLSGSLLIFWAISNGTLVRDVALSLAGFISATVTALVITGCLCLLTQCAPRRAISAALLRISPRTWTGAGSRSRIGGPQTIVHAQNTQRKQH